MVSFAAEPIFSLGFFKVTNAVLDTLLVDGLLIGLIVALNKKIALIPGKFQNLIEMAWRWAAASCGLDNSFQSHAAVRRSTSCAQTLLQG